ncbi:putative transposase IS891/IS1136/IS1341 family protein [Fischerella sp. NIES-4106]|nr:putative transposase IS891/IS1136/IS1341 family protein [Fischerella sp. NIES-4106]
MATRRMTFRLYPNKQIEQSLRYHRKLHKDLYNAAVYNRFTQYQKFNHSVSYFEQQNCLPAFKEVWTEYKEINYQALQATLKRVDYTHKQIDAPKFLRNAEQLIKKASKKKRRKQAPNRKKKIKASRRWKKAQTTVSKIIRKVANQRQNWVHHVATEIVSGNSFVATEKLEVKNMTSKAKKGKRKKQKAGLNKSILDVGFGMLRSTIKYKVEQIGGVFVEVPTKKVKPSQTCPKCGHQHKKTLDVRVHECGVCGYVQDRDIAAAEVMLYWAKGNLPGLGTSLLDAESPSSTANTRTHRGSMRQLGAKKRQKSKSIGLEAETQTTGVVGLGSSCRFLFFF